MAGNSFGTVFTVSTFGESHGPALGCVVDGCPPGLAIDEALIQRDLDRRRPGQSKYTTQRREPDQVRILSGVFEGRSTGTPIALVIENQDQRSRDYGDIKDQYRPAHADFTYDAKYGVRDYRGGGPVVRSRDSGPGGRGGHCASLSRPVRRADPGVFIPAGGASPYNL